MAISGISGDLRTVKLYNYPIDPNSSVSLRDQMKTILEREISAGRWQEGDRMPTARELSRMTGVSASTATQALTLLYYEGYLERHVGRGSFLRRTKSSPKRRTGAIGIVVGRSWQPRHALSRRFGYIHDLIQEIDSELAEWDYVSRLFHDHEMADHGPEKQSITAADLRQVDGILSLGYLSEPVVEAARQVRLQAICLGTTETPHHVPYLNVDDRHEMWEAVDCLYQAGHRRIGFVHTISNPKIRRMRGRPDAFVGACEHLGIPPKPEWMAYVGREDDVDLARIRDFLEMKNRPTAAVCINEWVGKGLYDVASILNCRIPEDLSLICTTANLEFGTAFSPALSTMVTDTAALSREAVRLLVEMIKLEQPPTINGYLIRSVLQKRESVCPPK